MAETLLTITKDAQGSSYKATIALRCTDRDHEIMIDQHGPVEVECGSSFSETLPVVGAISVVLPSALRDFPDQFPYTQYFTAENEGGDHVAAMNKLDAWIMHMTKSTGIIQVALAALWATVGDVDYDDIDSAKLETP